ncbi:MAG: ABC transporter ATP-binding protein [Spongiibacter marinus]|uniref:ABC transporter ATP-binding protein n=1 Tax=Spongiibacter marinus TaxID=354246 RepID=UPI003C627261
MIKVEKLSKTVPSGDGELRILKGIDLEIKAGQSAAIVGPSGSGKSTLLGLLAGLDSPSEGDVLLQGQSLASMSEDQRAALRARSVGFVFQSFQLLPSLTALENVMLPLELAGMEAPRQRASTLLEELELGHRQHHYPRLLSGGEQQRVAIARAFASEPAILFADEPTGNLDAKTGAHITELLFSLNRDKGTTLVLVTHEQGLADHCQRVFEMYDGELSELQRQRSC